MKRLNGPRLLPLRPLNWRRLASVVAGTLVVGLVVVLVSRASALYTAAETEAGTHTSGAAVITDSGASGGAALTFNPAVPVNTSVNFGQTVQALAPDAFAGTISTYGSGGGSIAVSAKQRAALSSLGLGRYRIPLKWNGGNIISSAGGGPTNVSGDTWVNQIKALGAKPMIVLGGATDNAITPGEAASMVAHFNPSNRVDYWVIGNEPGNEGISIGSYCSLFNSVYDAMKAVDPTIKIAGPAWAYYDAATLQTFLNCAGSRVDIIDYHHYAMGTSYLDNATALAQTSSWESEIGAIRAMVAATVPGRAAGIEVQVGEYNWSWRTADGYPGWNGDDRFYQAVATVWGASVAGHIARAGGRGHEYSDQNGALGLTFETAGDAAHFGRGINDPLPVYEGLRMFSGGSLFRGFQGSLVQTSTTLANVEVYASGNHNVVMINKSPTQAQTATVQVAGVTPAAVDVWQTDQAAPLADPVKKSTLGGGTSFSYPLPPYSATTFVLN